MYLGGGDQEAYLIDLERGVLITHTVFSSL